MAAKKNDLNLLQTAGTIVGVSIGLALAAKYVFKESKGVVITAVFCGLLVGFITDAQIQNPLPKA